MILLDVMREIFLCGPEKLIFKSLIVRNFARDFHDRQIKKTLLLFLLWDEKEHMWTYKTWSPLSQRKLLKASTLCIRGSYDMIVEYMKKCHENGLICLDLESTIIFNPTSGKTKTLPLHRFDQPLSMERVKRTSFLGFVPVSCLYKNTLRDHRRAICKWVPFLLCGRLWKNLEGVHHIDSWTIWKILEHRMF